MNWIRPSCSAPSLTLGAVMLAFAGTASAYDVPPTETQVLTALANDGAQPSLTRLEKTANDLAAASSEFCKKRDAASLEEAQSSWRKAYLAERRAEPFLFGPMGNQVRSLQSWPAHELVMKTKSPKDFRSLPNRPDLHGYAASEYLLFVLFMPQGAAVEATPERCDYLIEVTSEIAKVTSQARQGWDETFGKEFVSAGDNDTFMLPRDALSMAFAKMLDMTEVLLRERIGIASGLLLATARPDYLEARYSKSEWDSFAATAEGLNLALVGDGTNSFTGLIAFKDGLISRKDPALAADIKEQLRKVRKTVSEFSGRSIELPRDRAKLAEVYQDFAKLQDDLVEASLVLELEFSKKKMG